MSAGRAVPRSARDRGGRGGRRQAEYLIRKSLLDRRLIDAVIALPLNIFCGAGAPACLLTLGKDRPKPRRDKLLLVDAARHYRELSNKNRPRPQDVTRILVHYHAHGDGSRAAKLVAEHSKRLKARIGADRDEEVGRIRAEFEERFPVSPEPQASVGKANKARAAAEKERAAVGAGGAELVSLYANPSELAKHARVADVSAGEENEFSLNVPRYVDTFEPEGPIDVAAALTALDAVERAQRAGIAPPGTAEG